MTLTYQSSNKKIAYNMTTQSPEVIDLKSGVITAIKFLLCNIDPTNFLSSILNIRYIYSTACSPLFLQVKTTPECEDNKVHESLNHIIRDVFDRLIINSLKLQMPIVTTM